MTELMSPCGSFETLNAAIKAGCDSVYFGIKELNMRTGRAKNFDISDLTKIKSICAKSNVKCYLTLNSIVYDSELKRVDEILDEVKKSKIDAVIASDWAIILNANKKGIPVHISTQQSCSNIDALKFFSKHAERIVLARELSLEQIKDLKDKIIEEKIKCSTGKLMQIEVFCHGAMCISVSGRCFMSQFVHNCSANRGQCLQNCRREYIIKDAEEGHELKVGKGYVLSPKDLCTLPILDVILAKARPDVLKIEGRGRSVDYVYKVTKAYREALDAIESNIKGTKEIKYDKEMKDRLVDELKGVYNRDFTTGFFLGQPLNEWCRAYGSKAVKKKVYIGKVINYFSKANACEVLIESNEDILKKGDDIAFSGETTGYFEDKAEEIRNSKTDKPIASARRGDIITLKVSQKLRKNDKIYVIRRVDSN